MDFPHRFKPAVSDKAVLAWLEHVHDLDPAQVRREILADRRGHWIGWGASLVRVPQLRVDLVADHGVVVTIHTHDWKRP